MFSRELMVIILLTAFNTVSTRLQLPREPLDMSLLWSALTSVVLKTKSHLTLVKKQSKGFSEVDWHLPTLLSLTLRCTYIMITDSTDDQC